MKHLLVFLAAMVCQPTIARLQQPDSLSATETRAYAAALVHYAQRYERNAEGREGAEKAVFELYRDLYDEDMLRERGVLLSPRSGRYVTPQTTIDYGILPPDSTLNTVRELLRAPVRADSTAIPLPENLARLLDSLIPFRVEEQAAFRKIVCHRIDPFYPETIYPADSMVYIPKNLLKNIELFSKNGHEIGPARGRERDDFLAAEFSVKSSLFIPYAHWIDRPLTILSVIFEDNLRRAFVNAMSGGGKNGWGLLAECDAEGRWNIVEAQVLYSANL